MIKPIKHHNGWRVRWIEYGERKSLTFTDKISAKQAADEINRQQINVRLAGIAKPKLSFTEFTDYWLKNHASMKRSFKDKESIVRAHLRPAFGETLISKISGESISLFTYEKLKSHSPKTVANILTELRTILNTAKKLEWIDRVPYIQHPKLTDQGDYRWLKSKDDIKIFLESAKTEGPLVYSFYKTTIATGLRAGELAGLKRDDIDFKNNIIHVRRSFDGPTKPGKTRVVPLLSNLHLDLEKWLKSHDNEFVFFNARGSQFKESSRIYQEIFKRVLAKGKFPKVQYHGKLKYYICFHDLRHTFASHWVMNGGDIFKLQKILGHANISMTMKYAHLTPNAFAQDLNRISF
jgi:integrase